MLALLAPLGLVLTGVAPWDDRYAAVTQPRALGPEAATSPPTGARTGTSMRQAWCACTAGNGEPGLAMAPGPHPVWPRRVPLRVAGAGSGGVDRTYGSQAARGADAGAGPRHGARARRAAR